MEHEELMEMIADMIDRSSTLDFLLATTAILEERGYEPEAELTKRAANI
jgi:hypothetical protein